MENKLPLPRQMTRRERKLFDQTGLNPFRLTAEERKNIDPFALNQQLNDWIIDNVYVPNHPDVDFDEFGNNDLAELADKTYRLTYGMPDDIKNLLPSGTGTVSEQATAETV